MAKTKHDVITFKADEALLEAMRGIRNRSEFIRTAVLAAMDNLCPLCKGSGILTPNQKSHWNAFAADHSVQECEDCEELHLVCANQPAHGPHAGEAS